METVDMSGLYSTTEAETLGWNIEPLYENYRDLPIWEGFNWSKLFTEVAEHRGQALSQYYLVEFSSMRRRSEEIACRIGELNTAAFEEAKQSMALLHYFGGDVDEEGRAKSWCLWTDAASAHEALNGPAHKEAVRAAKELYELHGVKCYEVNPLGEQGVEFTLVAEYES